MAPVRELSFEQKVRIVLLDEGVSEKKIAERMKISKTGVHKTIKRFKETGQYCDLPRPGQPRKIDEHGDCRITRLSMSNRKLTDPQIMREYNETAEKLVCVWTIRAAKKSVAKESKQGETTTMGSQTIQLDNKSMECSSMER
ncbi:uncharacterized protein LOC136088267 [Hydra vulgaris]|uniref:Uncharacterized protein LOC136088267 n=1 Tax=Hydra vulgaris TaxID=6087 RepID=A0ABM4D1C0_HYDVU